MDVIDHQFFLGDFNEAYNRLLPILRDFYTDAELETILHKTDFESLYLVSSLSDMRELEVMFETSINVGCVDAIGINFTNLNCEDTQPVAQYLSREQNNQGSYNIHFVEGVAVLHGHIVDTQLFLNQNGIDLNILRQYQ